VTTIIAALLTMGLLGGMLLLLPRLARPTVPFGVRVPESRVDAPVIREATDRYYRGVLLAILVVASATVLFALLIPAEAVLAIAPFALIAAWIPPFLAARRIVQDAKRTEGWFHGVRQMAVADTSLRTEPPRYPWPWAVPAIVIALATVAVGIAVYPTLPDRIAAHVGPSGPDRFADTTLSTAFSLVGVQLVLTAMLLGLVVVALRGKADLAAAAPAASAEQYRRYAVIMARAVLALAAAMNLTLLVVALMVWEVVPATAGWLIASMVLTAVAAVALVVLSIRTGQSGYRLRSVAEQDGPGTTGSDRDDDTHWKAGLFYVNKDDPALWVPKRFGGVGWTVNFGRPLAWVLTVAVLGGALGVTVWAFIRDADSDDPGESVEPAADRPAADLAPIEGTPVGDRLDWMLNALAADEPPSEAAITEAFDGVVLSQASAAQLQSVFAEYAGDYDVTALITATPVTVTADIDDGDGRRWRHILTVGGYQPDARIAGIYFLPVTDSHRYAGWDEVGTALAEHAGDVTYLAAEIDGTTCRPLAAQASADQRPVGSAIKLYVLGALADAVAAGTVAWDDEVVVENHLRSIPAGLLQDAERGTTVTVAEAAELMMALSDNTATDHLIALLGRAAVEQALGDFGHAQPQLNQPLLTTREFAQLKWQVDTETRTAYIEADAAGRRAVLDELAGEPLDVTLTATPVAPDTVGWFASPDDLCAALARLDDVAKQPGLEPVGHFLAASSIVRVDQDSWTRTAAKGGSEPGVLAYGWLLERMDGRTFAFATTLLHDGPIYQGAVTPVVEGALDLLADERG
jgi:uncharacterized membrane protein/beta-lactamase class A